ncbi:conjugal transfer protein TraF [Vibrio parahaemolyticus]|uniref:Conjugal transfer protein TraF n=2 Tax=Vibrionaceae TaxID=641 RepID=A0AAW3IVZ2_VIBPH|nr:conjugal transfer protein TraF [Vibrio parahaemolyticus]EGQ9190616.1 conjugal transfer protein TraF [Vibrio parahaemolyticus]EGR3352700.1 type IX secretion system membrane protein PorP/SprF [Vibrio parahaemolyticus]EJG1849947.1 conjugal transfer protein TraF [Vibrio parahaemolyticus]ELI1807823.1 conjugal transfer protein TraF [Vibrio parahaemolyticus]KOY32352.1 conjugal transfer protein TraF [Vibrio parahaemolyticus]
MKTQFKILATTITASLFANVASAATYAIEARSDAMGGVGTVSASYLTAPFFNPALTAIYRRNDDAGMIIPSFGISYDDQYDLIDEIERISKLTDVDEIKKSMDAIDGKKMDFDLGGVVAVGIPNKFLSATVYGKLYTESFVQPNVDTSGVDPLTDSYVQGVSIGVAEAGMSLAKYTNFMNQHLSFGITPKLQRIYTYSYTTSFKNFDTKDLREHETAETMFNLDAGALWFFGPYRLGISAKNLIGRDVKTKSFQYNTDTIQSYEYSMRPVYTVGAGIVADYFTMSVDYDLNEEKRFSSFDDNTQMIRAGFEIDILRQMALRGGYMKNLARSNDEGTITAGIGLSPLKLIELDIAARYTNENAMGASINFLATY